MGFNQIKVLLDKGEMTRDTAWTLGMEHPVWDEGAAIRSYIIDLNEGEVK